MRIILVIPLLAACSQGVSVPDVPAAACTTDAECGAGEVCFEGYCAASAATPDTLVLPKPGLIDLDFSADTMPDAARLIRATAANVIDADGIVREVAADSPRFERDRRFQMPRGILVEPSTTNFCAPSENLTDPLWWSARTQRTANAAIAPDGTMTAVRLSPSVALEYHSIGYDFTAETGVTYVFSIFLKAGELSDVYVGVGGDGGYPSQLLNLTDGTLSQINALEAIVAAGAIDVGNGWYRAWVAFTRAGLDTNLNVMLELGRMDVDASKGLYAWGCQIERGSVPTSYVSSTRGGSRAADRLTLADPALLDTGNDFTMLIVQSVDIAAAGTPATGLVVSPEGSSNELILGQRAAGNAGLLIQRQSLLPLNIAAGNAWRSGELHVIAATRKGPSFVLFDNGIAVRGYADEFPTAPTPADLVAIGQPAGSDTAPTRIRRVVFWQEALDESALVDLTRP